MLKLDHRVSNPLRAQVEQLLRELVRQPQYQRSALAVVARFPGGRGCLGSQNIRVKPVADRDCMGAERKQNEQIPIMRNCMATAGIVRVCSVIHVDSSLTWDPDATEPGIVVAVGRVG